MLGSGMVVVVVLRKVDDGAQNRLVVEEGNLLGQLEMVKL